VNIKDSGARETYSSGMVREPQGDREDFTLCFPEAVPYDEQLFVRFARHMTKGAAKYTRRNWEQAGTQEELERYYASAFRHFMQWYCGDTSEDHPAGIIFNIQAAEFVKGRLDGKW
jgi:hypothetical protein